jgi:hypothetical protein
LTKTDMDDQLLEAVTAAIKAREEWSLLGGGKCLSLFL